MGAKEILRDALFGNPPSLTKQPSREGVLAAFAEIETSIASLALATIAGRAYPTRDQLYGDLTPSVGTVALVYNDPDVVRNGFYVRSGGGWVFTNINPASISQDLVALANNLAEEIAARIAEDDLRLPLSGGVMTGLINMGGNRLEGLAAPDSPDDAATAKFVQDKVDALVAGAPANLSTLAQLAIALGSDPDFAANTAALFEEIEGGYLPLVGNKSLTGPLGLGGNRLLAVADAVDNKDAMNRDMVYARTDPLQGAVSRGFSAGFLPGSTVPISEATVDGNGFLTAADGAQEFEPSPVFSSNGLVIVPAAEIDLGGGRLFRTIRNQVASPSVGSGNQRKDIVTADPQTGALSVTIGTERVSHAAYWTNTPPVGNIEIGRILRTSDGALFTPTFRRRAGLHVAQAAGDAFWLETSRAAVPRTHARLIRGLPVRIIAYGDSRMAMGNSTTYAQLNTHPNSDAAATPPYMRDVAGYFDLYDDATRARVLDQGRDFQDGYGATHAREGYTWRMVRAIEAAYGVAFDAGPSPTGSSYRNWSLGGTHSGTGFVTDDPAGNQRAHGREPVRLNAMLADIISGQTLVVLGFGMNELGSATTYANLVAIARTCLAAGAEVMMISTTRPLAAWNENYRAVNAWRLTCRETVRAALDTGSAWVDASTLVAPEWLPSLGITEAEIADATNANHEGVNVQSAIGQRAARVLGGRV